MDGGTSQIVLARPIRELEAEITQLAGHINAASHRWLTLLAEFDNRKGWSDSATQSCAHWLNWKCGIAFGAAREKLRVAHALENLPLISASMAKGELSYSKVRELTRVASAPTEADLLMIARHGTASYVANTVRYFRRAKEAEELRRDAQQRADRSVSYHFDDDGSLILQARLPAEAAAVVMKALELAMEQVRATEQSLCDENVPAGTPTVKSTLRMKRADALALMAESFVQHGAEAMNGGDKYQIVVHVAEETLRDREAGQCEFEDGASMAAETCRRLACDCCLVHMTEDEDGGPLNVGRKTRSIPPALKRALNSRDKGCRFPGCCNTKWTDSHHIEHWANGGETKLSNLMTLCYFHHHAVHEGGVTIQSLDDGAYRFIKPNGESYGDYSPMSGDRQQLLSFLQLTPHHPEFVEGESLVPPRQWNGDKMDYGLAVQVLCQREAKVKRARRTETNLN